jgi:cytochrome c biogenesis protein CcmG/thiol:disulfide interchange protein DsbE
MSDAPQSAAPAASGTRPARRRASRLPYLLALLLLGALIVTPWFLRGRFQPVVSGTAAPEFAVTNLQGEPVSLEDYRGKVVLLNVWATWCEPCRQEMPSMERLYTRVRQLPAGQDFEILAISIDATKEKPNAIYGGATIEDLQAYAREIGFTFPIVRDPEGRVQQIYQTTGVPESFLVGRDGIIYKKHAGPTEWDSAPNLALIEDLLQRDRSVADTR